MSKRHFGYVLPKNGGHLDALRFNAEVPTDTYQEFLEVIAVISELRPFVIDYMGLEANFQSFERIENDIRTDYETMENPLIGARSLKPQSSRKLRVLFLIFSVQQVRFETVHRLGSGSVMVRRPVNTLK